MNPLLQILMHLFASSQAKPQPGAAAKPQTGAQQPNAQPQSPLGAVIPILLALAAHAAKNAAPPSAPGQQQPHGGPMQPQGVPAQQGRYGSTAAFRAPNQGGYAGPGPSESSSPGMAAMAALLGGGPTGGVSTYGSSSLGSLPAARK